MTEPTRSNVRLYLEDINATCFAFEDAKLPTVAYSVVGSKTACALYNKDLTDSSNKIIATSIGNPKVTITGTPVAGQVLTAQSGSAATWRTPESSSVSFIVYVAIDANPGGDGTIANPYNTIGEAISTYRDMPVTIMILPGDYGESIYVTAGMTIMGTPNSFIDNIYYDETSVTGGEVILMNCSVVTDIVFDMRSALASVNLKAYGCKTENLTSYNCGVTLNNCEVTTTMSTNDGNVVITGSNLSLYNLYSTAQIYNSFIREIVVNLSSGMTLKTANTTIEIGDIASAPANSIDIDSLARITTADVNHYKIVDHGKVNFAGTNIGISNTGTEFTDANIAYNNENVILIGNDNILNSNVDNSIVLGSGLTVAESNAVIFQDNISKMILKGLESSAGGSTIVFNPTTGRFSYATSSRNEKKNIMPHDLSKSVDIINALEVNTFTWKRDDTNDIGFIAEDIHAVDESLAVEDEVGNIRGVNHVRLFPHIIATLQVMQKRIDNLEDRLSKYESME